MESPISEKFDVFLSHRSEDKPLVEKLAEKLVEEGELNPFLDQWHLIPGEPWQESLEHALDHSSCCAVFIGESGLGSWENEEMRASLSRRVREEHFRVIPVLLPGATEAARLKLPTFLQRFTWVDFSIGIEDQKAFERLIAGIHGKAPGRPAQKLSARSLYVKKSIRDLMKAVLKDEGIDLSGIPFKLGCTIDVIIKRCQLLYPNIEPVEISKKINHARAVAFEEKYSKRSEKEDERFLDFNEWEMELLNVIRSAGLREISKCKAISVGIGNGMERPFFYSDFQEIVGVDVSQASLREAVKRIQKLKTICTNAEALDGVESNRFDLFISLRTFQSTLFDIDDALFQASRVLKVGGCVVLSIPYVFTDQGRVLKGLLRPNSHELDPDLPYEIADQMRRSLQTLGFDPIGIRTGLFEIYVYGQKSF